MRANVVVAPDEMVRKIMKAAFPGWKGKKVRIEPSAGTVNMASYWEGGSRDFYAFVRLPDLKSMPVPQQSAYDRPIAGIDKYQMTPGVIVVHLPVYRGKKLAPRIIVHPDNMNQLALPAPEVDLAFEEAAALLVSDRYISSFRADEFRKITGLGKQAYEAARASLRAKGLLKKNNAITIEGENVASNWRDEYDLCKQYGVERKSIW